MFCEAGIDTPHYSLLVLKDGFALECDPVAAEGALARLVFIRDCAGQLLEFLNKRAIWGEQKFSQLVAESVQNQDKPTARVGWT